MAESPRSDEGGSAEALAQKIFILTMVGIALYIGAVLIMAL